MKTREIVWQNSIPLLVIALVMVVGYNVYHPATLTSTSALILAGEETVAKTVAAPQAVAQPKTMVSPAPLPQPVTPLPIMPPTVLTKVLPVYPRSILQKGLSGTVLLSVYVGTTGRPEQIETKLSSGINELDESACAALAQWQFNPATQGGQALASWWEVPVRFEVN